MPKTKSKLNLRDSRTLKRLNELADNVVSAAQRGRDPAVDVPARTLSNIRYNKSKRILEMGGNTNRRQLFNLSQAKAYMQTMLVAQRRQPAHRGRQDAQPAKHVLHAQTRREGHERAHVRGPKANATRSSRTWRSCSIASARNFTWQRKSKATWWETSSSSIAATRSTAPAWAPAAMACPRSSSPR